MFCIQEKHKTVITEIFNDLIRKNEEAEQGRKVTKIKNARQVCLDTVNMIKSPVKITKNMDAITKLEKYSKTDYVLYYQEVYKPIFEIINYYSRDDIISTKYMRKIQENTRNLLTYNNFSMRFFEKISEVIKLQEENRKNITEAIEGNDGAFANITNPDIFFELYKLENELSTTIKAPIKQTEDIEEGTEKKITNTASLKSMMYNYIINSDYLPYVINNNKPMILDVINKTKVLKSKIIVIDRYASQLTKALKNYNEYKKEDFERSVLANTIELLVDGVKKQSEIYLERKVKRIKTEHTYHMLV
ncbi:hypothetical protein BDAP_002096 [Binucleata daphniae]